MTIAIGFPYFEGILVCADTQLTYPNGMKYTAHKIFTGDADTCPCIFAFADQSGLASEIRAKLFKRIAQFVSETKKQPVTEELHGIVESVMDEYGRLQLDLPLEFLLAIHPPSENPAIIHFDGKSVTVTDRPVVLGCGNDSLTRFILDNLYFCDMTWHQAVAFGCYVVKKATRYINGCGEPIEGAYITRTELSEIEADQIEWGCTTTELHEYETLSFWFKQF